jgi:hypothetical protein
MLPQHRLKVIENRMLRKTFGPERDEVKRSWRKLCNEALHNLYCSPYLVGKIESRGIS